MRVLIWHFGFLKGFGVGLMLEHFHGFILPSISLTSNQSHIRVLKAGRVLRNHLLCSAIFVSARLATVLPHSEITSLITPRGAWSLAVSIHVIQVETRTSLDHSYWLRGEHVAQRHL